MAICVMIWGLLSKFAYIFKKLKEGKKINIRYSFNIKNIFKTNTNTW